MFPHFLSYTHSCPTLRSPCWHLLTVTSNCPAVESSVAPKLLTQRQAPDDSHKCLPPLPTLSTLPRPSSRVRRCPFFHWNRPSLRHANACCRASAHVSARLWVCCRCVSSCPPVITLPPPSVLSAPTIGPIRLTPTLPPAFPPSLRGDLRSVAVRRVLTYFTPTLLFVLWPCDS